MLCFVVINVMSPAVENSLSAALLVLGKTIIVHASVQAQGFSGKTLNTELFS